jgi:Ca-activated chloride channel family protein
MALVVMLALSLLGCSLWRTDGTSSGGYPSAYDNSYESDYNYQDFNTEEYTAYDENGFQSVATNPTSTFSASVDTASYANLRRLINDGAGLDKIPSDAVRVEEFLNYFKYDFAAPVGDEPFAMSAQIADCPWNEDTRLMILGLQAQGSSSNAEKGSNLVFLIDVSGSMDEPKKLPLLVESFSYLVDQLKPADRISIVTYAGSEQVVLEGAYAENKQRILKSLEKLEAGGTTAGQRGLQRAYEIAENYYIEDGNNRIIMASDGDLNVGITNESDLNDYVSGKRDSGVYLSVLGFGAGNYKDNKMKTLAQNGNGNYHYIDSIDEAQKVFGEDLTANLYSVADDVKVQVEFNPAYVKGYRQIGYETRQLTHEDFSNDAKDASELGAGHQVIVAYEIVMKDSKYEFKGGDLKYQEADPGVENGEWLTIAVAYKNPGESKSNTLDYAFGEASYTDKPSTDWLFAAGVIEFAMITAKSDYKGTTTLKSASELIESGEKSDKYRKELSGLINKLD